jgi:catechol 2,3-dioxygenase-like lactoylglutathione lyase family enzyme
MLGFHEVHREEVLGADQVREVLLRVGDGPNLIQLIEPLTADSPVQKLIDRNGGRGGLAHVAFRVKSAQHAFDFSNLHRPKLQRRCVAAAFFNKFLWSARRLLYQQQCEKLV